MMSGIDEPGKSGQTSGLARKGSCAGLKF